jgi:hypothetical protein
MSELKPSDPFSKVEWIIIRVFLIILLLLSIIKLLKAEWLSLW